MSLSDAIAKLGELSDPNDGWVGVNIPRDLRSRMRLIHGYIKPDDLTGDGIERKPHITLAYGLAKSLPDDILNKLITLPKGSKVKIKGLSTFDHPDQRVLKFDVDSEDLHRIHKQIEEEIGLPGKTFKKYRPHITVAYLKPESDIEKYRAFERMLKDKEFEVDDVNVRLGDNNYDSSKLLGKVASSATEQLGAMVPFMDFPYIAGLTGKELSDKQISSRNQSNMSDILLPPVGAYKYGQRMRAGFDKEKFGPYSEKNYVSEVLGPYTSTALVGLATMLGSIALNRGRVRGAGKAFLRGAGVGAGLNVAGWAGAKIDPMVTKEELEEMDAEKRWANWVVPGASKYHGVKRVEFVHEKPDTHEHLMDENKRLKPGVYIANRSVFRGVPLLGSYMKDARHSYIVAVPTNPERFKDKLVDIGNGNNVIIMGGYNEKLPSEMGKRQLAALYNKDRDIETLQTGLGIRKDTTRNYTKLKPITAGWSPIKIDKSIAKLTQEMDAYQQNTMRNPVIYKAYPSKSPKQVLKKRVSNCNSFAQTLLDRAGFDNRKTKINAIWNRLAPGDTTRIDFAFNKPAVTPVPMGAKPEEAVKVVEEMKKAAFLTGYNRATELIMQKNAGAATHAYAHLGREGLMNRNQGYPFYGPIGHEPQPEEKHSAPVMRDSSAWIDPVTSKIFGNGAAGTLANVGTYFIPGVGMVRSGYDAVADAANMFGKDLTLKQRLGYGLSSGFNAAFAGADAITLGMGGTAAKAILKPLTALFKSMKGGGKVIKYGKRFGRFAKQIAKGTHPWTKGAKGAPVKLLFSHVNPYASKKFFNPKAWAYGTARVGIPLGGMMYSGTLTEPKKKEEPEYDTSDYNPENYVMDDLE